MKGARRNSWTLDVPSAEIAIHVSKSTQEQKFEGQLTAKHSDRESTKYMGFAIRPTHLFVACGNVLDDLATAGEIQGRSEFCGITQGAGCIEGRGIEGNGRGVCGDEKA